MCVCMEGMRRRSAKTTSIMRKRQKMPKTEDSRSNKISMLLKNMDMKELNDMKVESLREVENDREGDWLVGRGMLFTASFAELLDPLNNVHIKL